MLIFIERALLLSPVVVRQIQPLFREVISWFSLGKARVDLADTRSGCGL